MKYKRIISVLIRLNQFLIEHRDEYMQPTISGYIDKLNKIDVEIPSNLLSEMRVTLFGGMGSLNDLSICKENGHYVIDEEQAKDELDNLREQLKAVWREEIGSLR